MHPSSIPDPLVRFGYQYLGPFLLDWYNRLTLKTAEQKSDTVFCLGREGWSLVPFFNTLEARRRGLKRFVYTPTSRAFLTHLALARPELAGVALDSRFHGALRDFAEARLGVPLEYLDLQEAGDQVIILPRHKAYVSALVERNAETLRSAAKSSHAAYGRYLAGLGWSSSACNVLVDLGFRGTSQALLSALFGYKIAGFYAILDPAGVPPPLSLAEGSAFGLFADRHSFGQDFAPLECSLLLEAFLTAPTGQVIGIQDVVRGDPFVYRTTGPAQERFDIISACHQGAYKFAYDHADLIGTDQRTIADFEDFFGAFKDALQRNVELFEAALIVDDSYFGAPVLDAGIKL